jgi:S-DNA-T family DNA segregation ATPase FtsK/SpoIIIE
MPRASTSASSRTRRSTKAAALPEPELPARRARGGEAVAHGKAAPARISSERAQQLQSDLLAIGCFLVGALVAVALYSKGGAGVAGGYLVEMLRFWIGQMVHVSPILFLGAGLALALDYRRTTSSQMLIGIGGLLGVLLGWTHLASTPSAQIWTSTGARLGWLFGHGGNAALMARPDGGLIGAFVMLLTWPLGRAGAYITFVAIGAASVLLVSDLTIRGIMERAHERSRIAGERARKRAQAISAKAQEVASNLPVRRPEAQKEIFLDLGSDRETESEEKPRRGFRRLLREKEPQPEPPVQGPAEPLLPIQAALVPVEEPKPAPRTVPKARPRPARAPAGDAGADSADYVLPPYTLLDAPAPRPKRSAADTQANIDILVNTLGQFRIQAEVVEIADGPSVTRYEIRLGEGIRVKKILDLADNIAMSLAAMSVRVEAPIPGKAAIGIEVPKKVATTVTLRECLESAEIRDFESKVAFVLGKDVAGNVRAADLAKMPHLLVAGATNSGKSVCLNALIASMLFRARPDELKLIMIDPKRVELTLFEGVPHLIHPVVKDVKQAAGILRWVLKEMDRRYDLFARVMTRNIEGYNGKVADKPGERLPFIVVVIDELADLMMQQGPEVEQSICRLAQLARATGIHLVVATQRPSVDVITGLIKANIPSRISFSVTSQVDSRTILDGKGAESLVGRGDMLFKPVDAAKPMRIQGAFLREGEVEALVNHLRTQGKPEYIAEALAVDHGAYGTASEEEAEDDMFEPAARFVVTTGHASTSMIQRKFKIGYTRAARLVDMMESRGIVGSLDGAKPREIMMSRDGLDQMFLNTRNSLYGGTDYAEAEEDEVEIELDETGPPSARDPFVEE